METLEALSDVADAAIEVAGRVTQAELTAQRGPPPCAWAVIGMGKLGSRELNLSSDIDLIYVYESDADPNAHAWFRRFFTRLTKRLNDRTEDGFVYRVDLDLRPEGSTGPICNSLPACERYYEAWGHPWERIAWVRARPVAGDGPLGQAMIEALEPFVYRRHLDLGALDEVATMKQEIDAKAHDLPRNIKLGPGGIREVEFFAHALQLVHGGRNPALRTRSTLEALDRLALDGLVSDRTRATLSAAYLYLRTLENQIQLIEDRQTHILPTGPDLDFIATALETTPDDLEATRQIHQNHVTAAWHALFPTPTQNSNMTSSSIKHDVKFEFGGLPAGPWHRSRWAAERDVAERLEREISGCADPEQAVVLLRTLIRGLSPKTGLWTFLRAHPRRLTALVNLLATSRYLGNLVARDPRLLEAVVFGAGGPPRRDREELVGLLLRGSVASDAEAALGGLRRAHAGELLRVGFYELGGELTLDEAAEHLTDLAEAAVAAALEVARAEIEARRGPLDCRFAVVGLGRFGAREMIWGSDLDLLFLYDGDRVAGGRLAQRLISALSLPMDSGKLYDVDARLRPSGNQGALLVTPQALLSHHRLRAATWEHQALLRARFVAGDAELGAAVDETIAAVLSLGHARSFVVGEVRRVRQRLLEEVARERRPTRGRAPTGSGGGDFVDLKFGRGGLVEIDLIVQTLRLLDGGKSLPARALPTWEALGLLDITGLLETAVAGALKEAYHFLRKLSSRLRIATARPDDRVARSGPAWELLARRLGYSDLPGRPGGAALNDAFERHTSAVTRIYDELLGE